MQTQSVTPEALMPPPSAEDGQLAWLPVRVIAPRAGHNPRRHFDMARMCELVASVRAQGVIQPIVVRAIDGGRYQIIAGERRWRAAREAGLDEIPTFVRVVDDLQSMQMAMVENTHRDDLAPSEEAQKARDLLTLCHGDRDAARRRLGWSAAKLDSRLALLHCIPAVLEALDARRLTLGHGELLATLVPDTQDGTLPRILEQGIGIAQLRERIGQVARPLGRAIFDQAACQGCAHNSEVQGQLFATHIDRGQCSNPKCYGEKTRLVLEAKKQAMAQEVATVWLDTEHAPEAYAVLEATGAIGVGSQQFAVDTAEPACLRRRSAGLVCARNRAPHSLSWEKGRADSPGRAVANLGLRRYRWRHPARRDQVTRPADRAHAAVPRAPMERLRLRGRAGMPRQCHGPAPGRCRRHVGVRARDLRYPVQPWQLSGQPGLSAGAG